jgi:hypothetical protein
MLIWDEFVTSVRIAYGRTAFPFTISHDQIFTCNALSLKGKIRFDQDKIKMMVPLEYIKFDNENDDNWEPYWEVSVNAMQLWSG